MKVIMTTIICTFLIFLVPFALASSTNSIEGQLDFIESAKSQQNYDKTINLNPPDGISDIIDAQIILRGDFQPDTTLFLTVNGEPCSPIRWNIQRGLLESATENYVATFDCTDVIKSHMFEDILISFNTDKIAENIKGTYKITYFNNPKTDDENIYKLIKTKISIGSTDYYVNETATIFAKLYDDQSYISDAHCDYMVFNSSSLVKSGKLTYIPFSRGLYSDSFQITSEGVYPVDVTCIKPYNNTKQTYYYRKGTQLQLRNSAGSIATTENLTDVGQQVFSCLPNFFTSYSSDFEDYIYIKNITNSYIFARKSGTGSSEFTFRLNYYLRNQYERIKIGTSENLTTIHAAYPTKVKFQTLVLEQPLLQNTTLEVEWCVKKETSTMNSLYFYFNSTLRNASFVLNTLSMNETLDFLVGGSSEIHVMDGNLSRVEDILLSHNSTAMNKLYAINGELANINESLQNKLDSALLKLNQLLDNQTILKQIIYDTNQTLYDKLLEMQGELSSIDGKIDQTNQTIMNKLYGIQDELANITNLTETAISLIFDTNQTIMNYLFQMNNTLWQEIYDVWNNINITNVTMTILANMTTLPRETWLYFQTVEEKLEHNNDSCVANQTIHRKEILVEKCVSGECFNITQQIDEYCIYGCSQGQCNPVPQIRFSIMLVAIILMLGFLYGIYQVARRT